MQLSNRQRQTFWVAFVATFHLHAGVTAQNYGKRLDPGKGAPRVPTAAPSNSPTDIFQIQNHKSPKHGKRNPLAHDLHVILLWCVRVFFSPVGFVF